MEEILTRDLLKMSKLSEKILIKVFLEEKQAMGWKCATFLQKYSPQTEIEVEGCTNIKGGNIEIISIIVFDHQQTSHDVIYRGVFSEQSIQFACAHHLQRLRKLEQGLKQMPIIRVPMHLIRLEKQCKFIFKQVRPPEQSKKEKKERLASPSKQKQQGAHQYRRCNCCSFLDSSRKNSFTGSNPVQEYFQKPTHSIHSHEEQKTCKSKEKYSLIKDCKHHEQLKGIAFENIGVQPSQNIKCHANRTVVNLKGKSIDNLENRGEKSQFLKRIIGKSFRGQKKQNLNEPSVVEKKQKSNTSQFFGLRNLKNQESIKKNIIQLSQPQSFHDKNSKPHQNTLEHHQKNSSKKESKPLLANHHRNFVSRGLKKSYQGSHHPQKDSKDSLNREGQEQLMKKAPEGNGDKTKRKGANVQQNSFEQISQNGEKQSGSRQSSFHKSSVNQISEEKEVTNYCQQDNGIQSNRTIKNQEIKREEMKNEDLTDFVGSFLKTHSLIQDSLCRPMEKEFQQFPQTNADKIVNYEPMELPNASKMRIELADFDSIGSSLKSVKQFSHDKAASGKELHTKKELQSIENTKDNIEKKKTLEEEIVSVKMIDKVEPEELKQQHSVSKLSRNNLKANSKKMSPKISPKIITPRQYAQKPQKIAKEKNKKQEEEITELEVAEKKEQLNLGQTAINFPFSNKVQEEQQAKKCSERKDIFLPNQENTPMLNQQAKQVEQSKGSQVEINDKTVPAQQGSQRQLSQQEGYQQSQSQFVSDLDEQKNIRGKGGVDLAERHPTSQNKKRGSQGLVNKQEEPTPAINQYALKEKSIEPIEIAQFNSITKQQSLGNLQKQNEHADCNSKQTIPQSQSLSRGKQQIKQRQDDRLNLFPVQSVNEGQQQAMGKIINRNMAMPFIKLDGATQGRQLSNEIVNVDQVRQRNETDLVEANEVDSDLSLAFQTREAKEEAQKSQTIENGASKRQKTQNISCQHISPAHNQSESLKVNKLEEQFCQPSRLGKSDSMEQNNEQLRAEPKEDQMPLEQLPNEHKGDKLETNKSMKKLTDIIFQRQDIYQEKPNQELAKSLQPIEPQPTKQTEKVQQQVSIQNQPQIALPHQKSGISENNSHPVSRSQSFIQVQSQIQLKTQKSENGSSGLNGVNGVRGVRDEGGMSTIVKQRCRQTNSANSIKQTPLLSKTKISEDQGQQQPISRKIAPKQARIQKNLEEEKFNLINKQAEQPQITENYKQPTQQILSLNQQVTNRQQKEKEEEKQGERDEKRDQERDQERDYEKQEEKYEEKEKAKEREEEEEVRYEEKEEKQDNTKMIQARNEEKQEITEVNQIIKITDKSQKEDITDRNPERYANSEEDQALIMTKIPPFLEQIQTDEFKQGIQMQKHNCFDDRNARDSQKRKQSRGKSSKKINGQLEIPCVIPLIQPVRLGSDPQYTQAARPLELSLNDQPAQTAQLDKSVSVSHAKPNQSISSVQQDSFQSSQHAQPISTVQTIYHDTPVQLGQPVQPNLAFKHGQAIQPFKHVQLEQPNQLYQIVQQSPQTQSVSHNQLGGPFQQLSELNSTVRLDQTAQIDQAARFDQTVQKIQALQPVQLDQPAQLVQTVQHGQPKELVKPVQLGQSGQIMQPVQPIKSTQLDSNFLLGEPIQPSKFGQLNQLVSSVQLAESADLNSTLQLAQPAKLDSTAQLRQLIKPVQLGQHIQPAKIYQLGQSVQFFPPVQPAQRIQFDSTVQLQQNASRNSTVQTLKHDQPAQIASTVQLVRPTQLNSNVPIVQSIKSAKDVQIEQPVQLRQPAQINSIVQLAQPKESVRLGQPVNAVQSLIKNITVPITDEKAKVTSQPLPMLHTQLVQNSNFETGSQTAHVQQTNLFGQEQNQQSVSSFNNRSFEKPIHKKKEDTEKINQQKQKCRAILTPKCQKNQQEDGSKDKHMTLNNQSEYPPIQEKRQTIVHQSITKNEIPIETDKNEGSRPTGVRTNISTNEVSQQLKEEENKCAQLGSNRRFLPSSAKEQLNRQGDYPYNKLKQPQNHSQSTSINPILLENTCNQDCQTAIEDFIEKTDQINVGYSINQSKLTFQQILPEIEVSVGHLQSNKQVIKSEEPVSSKKQNSNIGNNLANQTKQAQTIQIQTDDLIDLYEQKKYLQVKQNNLEIISLETTQIPPLLKGIPSSVHSQQDASLQTDSTKMEPATLQNTFISLSEQNRPKLMNSKEKLFKFNGNELKANHIFNKLSYNGKEFNQHSSKEYTGQKDNCQKSKKLRGEEKSVSSPLFFNDHPLAKNTAFRESETSFTNEVRLGNPQSMDTINQAPLLQNKIGQQREAITSKAALDHPEVNKPCFNIFKVLNQPHAHPKIIDQIIIANVSQIPIIKGHPHEQQKHLKNIKAAIKFVDKFLPSFMQEKLFSIESREICLFLEQEWKILKCKAFQSRNTEVLMKMASRYVRDDHSFFDCVEMLTGMPYRMLRGYSDGKNLAKTMRLLLSSPNQYQSYEQLCYMVSDLEHVTLICEKIKGYQAVSKLANANKKHYILECRTLEDEPHQVESTKVNEYCVMSLSKQLQYKTIEVNSQAVNTFELSLTDTLIYVKGSYRLILYREFSSNKYEFVKEGHCSLKHFCSGKSTYLLIMEPLKDKKGESKLTIRYGVDAKESSKSDWTEKIMSMVQGMVQDRNSKASNGGYENANSVYLPVKL